MTDPDAELHQQIADLTAEQHRIRSSEPPHDQDRLAELDREIDQRWDLVRQRVAARDAGADPQQARTRGQDEVEGYLQ